MWKVWAMAYLLHHCEFCWMQLPDFLHNQHGLRAMYERMYIRYIHHRHVVYGTVDRCKANFHSYVNCLRTGHLMIRVLLHVFLQWCQMGVNASRPTCLSIFYSAVCSGWHQRKHSSSASLNHTSNGSWCMGIKGEMSGTVCVTFTWYMYIYELFIAFVCFVVCSLL